MDEGALIKVSMWVIRFLLIDFVEIGKSEFEKLVSVFVFYFYFIHGLYNKKKELHLLKCRGHVLIQATCIIHAFLNIFCFTAYRFYLTYFKQQGNLLQFKSLYIIKLHLN